MHNLEPSELETAIQEAYTGSGEKENQEMTLKMTLWIKVLAAHALRPEFNSQNLGKGGRKE